MFELSPPYVVPYLLVLVGSITVIAAAFGYRTWVYAGQRSFEMDVAESNVAESNAAGSNVAGSSVTESSVTESNVVESNVTESIARSEDAPVPAIVTAAFSEQYAELAEREADVARREQQLAEREETIRELDEHCRRAAQEIKELKALQADRDRQESRDEMEADLAGKLGPLLEETLNRRDREWWARFEHGQEALAARVDGLVEESSRKVCLQIGADSHNLFQQIAGYVRQLDSNTSKLLVALNEHGGSAGLKTLAEQALSGRAGVEAESEIWRQLEMLEVPTDSGETDAGERRIEVVDAMQADEGMLVCVLLRQAPSADYRPDTDAA